MVLDDAPWFVAKDAATVLGYANTAEAVRVHVEPMDKQSISLGLPGRAPVLVNESGLYSLVLGSKLDGAKTFKRGVTSVVLPAIRKDGAFPVTPSRTRPPAALASQEPAAPVP